MSTEEDKKKSPESPDNSARSRMLKWAAGILAVGGLIGTAMWQEYQRKQELEGAREENQALLLQLNERGFHEKLRADPEGTTKKTKELFIGYMAKLEGITGKQIDTQPITKTLDDAVAHMEAARAEDKDYAKKVESLLAAAQDIRDTSWALRKILPTDGDTNDAKLTEIVTYLNAVEGSLGSLLGKFEYKAKHIVGGNLEQSCNLYVTVKFLNKDSAIIDYELRGLADGPKGPVDTYAVASQKIRMKDSLPDDSVSFPYGEEKGKPLLTVPLKGMDARATATHLAAALQQRVSDGASVAELFPGPYKAIEVLPVGAPGIPRERIRIEEIYKNRRIIELQQK